MPLASGLLSGRYTQSTHFSADDHRSYNRDGRSRSTSGETFSGVDFETGLEAVRRLAPHVPAGVTMAQWALRFVLDQPGVSVVIPGARNPDQARGQRGGGAARAARCRLDRGDPRGVRRADPTDSARALVARRVG